METDVFISKQEFVNNFKYEYHLLANDKNVLHSYKTFKKTVRRLRKESIQSLKTAGMSGQLRMEYNQALEKLSHPSHRRYLFHKNPVCGICNRFIASIREATIDHIIPRVHGGSNSLHNKQLAHGPCNVAKGSKLDFKIEIKTVF